MVTDPEPSALPEVLQADGTIPPLDVLIRAKYRHRCGNCGSDHKLRVKLVVPLEAGGHEIESNAILICRACEMASDTSTPLPGTSGERRIINFWVSRATHTRMSNGMATSRGLRSSSALVRYLIASYVADTKRFDDLDRFQDTGTSDIKINVWVAKDQYESFKVLVAEKGLSVTEAVRSLIGLFDSEVSESPDSQPDPGSY